MRRYSEEQIQFIRDHYAEWFIDELTARFNAKFGLNKTRVQIRSVAKNRGITSGRSHGAFHKGKYKVVTQAQGDYIKKMYRQLPLKDLVVQFNQQFGTRKSEDQLRAFVKNNKIKSGRTGHWSERENWNKGTKGVMKANSGSYAPGCTPINANALRTERLNADGYVEIKVPEKNPHNGQKTRYKLKHRWLWEQANGPIPDSHALMFIDADRRNCALSNLELIPRAELMALTQLEYAKAPEAMRPTIRTLAKLQLASNRKRMTDPTMSMKQQVLAAIRERPRTYRCIERDTGIRGSSVASIISQLKRKEKIKDIGKTIAHTGYECTVWAAVE